MTAGEDAEALVGVAVPVPIRRTFTYRVPSEQRDGIALGTRVRVPFGRRSVKGTVVVWPAPAPDPGVEVRDLEAGLPDSPKLDAHLLELTRFIADYYLCSWGEAIEAALPPDPPPRKRLPRAVVSSASASPTAPFRALSPTPAQSAVLGRLLPAVAARSFAPFLLWGATGSGKTEVYLLAAAAALAAGRSVLYLVPEIGLSACAECAWSTSIAGAGLDCSPRA